MTATQILAEARARAGDRPSTAAEMEDLMQRERVR